MASKFKVTRFDETGNIGLWQTRVKDLLSQQGISKALSDKKPAKVDVDKWEEMQAQAASGDDQAVPLGSNHVPCHGGDVT